LSEEPAAQMVRVKRLVLDVLKPHQPGAIEFGMSLARQGGIRVKVTVVELDEKTETLQVVVEGQDIDCERIQAAIGEFGASLHSVDEVEVMGEAEESQ
jgi:hypothetical protein